MLNVAMLVIVSYIGQLKINISEICGIYDINQVDIVLINKNQVAILNKSEGEINILNMQGIIVKKFGSMGQGPGSFASASRIYQPSESDDFIVTDFRKREISIWSRNGFFIKSYKLNDVPKSALYPDLELNIF